MRVLDAQQTSGMFESIQVRYRFTHGEHHLMRIEIPREQGHQ